MPGRSLGYLATLPKAMQGAARSAGPCPTCGVCHVAGTRLHTFQQIMPSQSRMATSSVGSSILCMLFAVPLLELASCRTCLHLRTVQRACPIYQEVLFPKHASNLLPVAVLQQVTFAQQVWQQPVVGEGRGRVLAIQHSWWIVVSNIISHEHLFANLCRQGPLQHIWSAT